MWGCLLGLFLCFSFSGAIAAPEPPRAETYPQTRLIKGVIKNGDTASSLLNSYLPLKTIYEISRQSDPVHPISRLRKGQPYRITLEQNTLVKYEYEIDEDDRLVVEKSGHTYTVFKLPIYYDVNMELVSATITYSLNGTIRKMGEKSELAFRLADIFAWDIDFIRDIRSGDKFKVLVEKKYRQGRLCGYGNIKAAFFTNQGHTYKAFAHTDTNGITGFYDENGQSLQKAFLKAPLAYSRISSKFTKKRLHPILNQVRAHNGVDYAASTGTPVKTVGDGIITDIGYNKGAGNYIRIRHPNGFTTRYFHMSAFAKKMKRNQKVLQGQVIGYVGQTGYATGPHLCFRMEKNGKHIDPLSYRAPSAKPVNPDEMDSFLTRTMALSERILAAGQPDVVIPAT